MGMGRFVGNTSLPFDILRDFYWKANVYLQQVSVWILSTKNYRKEKFTQWCNINAKIFTVRYSESSQKSEMELFLKIVSNWKLLTISTKTSILGDIYLYTCKQTNYHPSTTIQFWSILHPPPCMSLSGLDTPPWKLHFRIFFKKFNKEINTLMW